MARGRDTTIIMQYRDRKNLLMKMLNNILTKRIFVAVKLAGTFSYLEDLPRRHMSLGSPALGSLVLWLRGLN